MRPPGEGFVPKAWGWERVVVNCPKYCGKLMSVAAGRRCSWHRHLTKEETFHLLSGVVRLRWIPVEQFAELTGRWGWSVEHALAAGAEEVLLRPGDSFHLPPGTLHQFEAVRDAVIAEFSSEHRDDDTVRVMPGSA